MSVHISDINDTVYTLLHNGYAELEWNFNKELRHISLWKDPDGTVIIVLDIACEANGWSFQPVNPPWSGNNPSAADIRNALLSMCQ